MPPEQEQEVRLLANCVVGLGFSYRGFRAGLEREPHAIGCDAGSADYGPAFLGSGRDPKSVLAVERDLTIMLEGARELDVPLVIGSCGGAGGRTHLAGYEALVRSIAKRRGLRFTLATIGATQDPDRIKRALSDGQVSPLGPINALDARDIEASSEIVAMMGSAPLRRALEQGADVILAGRCADAAIFAAPALHHGATEAVAWHAAKVIDKGYLATTEPLDGSPVLATLRGDHFDVEPTKASSRCTIASVAKQTLYENPDPYRVAYPEGVICLEEAEYEQLDDSRVRVRGSRFESAIAPVVKLEGAAAAGYRAVLVAGIRDSRVLTRLDDFIAEFEAQLRRSAASLGVADDDWTLRVLAYGRDGVLGPLEPMRDQVPHEVGLMVDIVASTEEIAVALATRAGPAGSKATFTRWTGGGGNFAYPFSPNVLNGGSVYRWTVWHLLQVIDTLTPFEIEMSDV
jgi:hypothetical protein